MSRFKIFQTHIKMGNFETAVKRMEQDINDYVLNKPNFKVGSFFECRGILICHVVIG